MNQKTNTVQPNRVPIPGSELTVPAPAPEAHYTVYRLSDPEGLVYIGVTGKTVEERWLKGRGYPKGLPIREAIIRYGWENFRHDILCEKLTKEGAEKLEKWFIAYYQSDDPARGYNRFLGGLGKGARMSETTKKLASEAKIRLYAEHPEIREKIRQTVNLTFASDPTYRLRVSKGVLAAYERDPSIKARLSEITKELWTDPDYRERATEGRRKASEDPALAERLRAAQKGNYTRDPERKERIRRQMQDYLSRPENRSFVESDSHAKPVICVETGETYPSQQAAERAVGFRGIHKACLGYQRTCGGYHWKYASSDPVFS